MLRLTAPPLYWRCEPGWSWSALPLPDYLLWWVMDGAGQLTLRGRSWDLVPGTSIVFAPGDQPQASHEPQRRLLVFGMHFTTGQEAQPDLRGLLPARPRLVHDQGFLAAVAARAEAGYRRGDALGARQSRLCLQQMLCLLHEEASRAWPSWADLIIDDIARSVRQDPGQAWTVPQLAGQASLSTPQFTRRFRSRTGMAPGHFIVLARIERARKLLAETAMTVSQIARDLGYHDPAHFSRQYRRYTGHAPAARRHRSPP